jgi:tRNA splicing endonuclease
MARAKFEDKSEGELEQIIEKKERKSRDLFIRKYGRTPEEFESEQQLFNEVIYLERANPLDVLTAEHLIRIDKLLALRSEVETRKTLLDSVLGRYSSAMSVVSINSVSYIENTDIDGVGGVERVVSKGDSLPDLATG